MRKNGVNREVRMIEGGLCAPEGFMLHVVSYGYSKENSNSADIGLLYGDRRYPTAFVGASNSTQGVALRVTQRQIKNGYAQAIVFCSGEENVFSQENERFAEMICEAVSHRLKIDIADVGILSIGDAKKHLLPSLLENKIKELAEGLNCSFLKSRLAAKVLAGKSQMIKEFTFAFDLGDYPCKMGAVFSTRGRSVESVAPLLCFITTDVCISSSMLQKALETEVRDTFDMLSLDGIVSSSDMICIMSSCKAGNYKIDQADSEYKKFCTALHEVAANICKEIASEARDSQKAFICCVTGAQSKSLSRKIAKAIAGNVAVKYHLGKGKVLPQDITVIVSQYIDLSQTEEFIITLSSTTGTSVLYEDGESLSIFSQRQKEICAGEDLELIVRIGRGNYTATAYGCDLV